jgi:uncharacterized protein (DUF362 family)
MIDSVALVKHTGNLGVKARQKSLEKAFELIESFENLTSPIIIKPNICCKPSSDLKRIKTTNVDMVEAFLKIALKKQEDLSIKIVESDSEGKFADENTFEKFGYKELQEKFKDQGTNISLINISQAPTVKIKFDGLYFKELELPKILTEPRFFVSIAVAKTHPLTVITGVIKNQFGLLPRKNKMFYHPHINQIILDLNRFIRPDLGIIDAIIGLEKIWDSKSKKRVNAIIVGKNPVSVDSTLARIMGFNPEKIFHIVKAEKYGLGTLNPKILGEKWETMTVKFTLPDSIKPTAFMTPPTKKRIEEIRDPNY